MYVNPFWFGVLMTLFTEIMLCILYVGVKGSKK